MNTHRPFFFLSFFLKKDLIHFLLDSSSKIFRWIKYLEVSIKVKITVTKAARFRVADLFLHMFSKLARELCCSLLCSC